MRTTWDTLVGHCGVHLRSCHLVHHKPRQQVPAHELLQDVHEGGARHQLLWRDVQQLQAGPLLAQLLRQACPMSYLVMSCAQTDTRGTWQLLAVMYSSFRLAAHCGSCSLSISCLEG